MNGNMILLLPMILPLIAGLITGFLKEEKQCNLWVFIVMTGAGLDAGFWGLYAGGMAVYGPARYCIPYRWAGEILCLPD